MANIYNIQQDLLNIFAEIEDNDGELTPELEEALNISRDNLKNKIQNYSDYIKILESDLFSIKAEKDRLTALQKSKERTIERLKKIMIEIITEFGDVTSSGTKYIDYGTGKVSIKNSKVVEVNEDNVNNFVNRYVSALVWYNNNNQFERNIINQEEVIDFVNQTSEDDEINLNFTQEDISKINTKIDLTLNLEELLNTDKGFNLAKALVQYGLFDINAKIDKNELKRIEKETGKLPCFAEIINKQNISIK